jgi:hypothetical protein
VEIQVSSKNFFEAHQSMLDTERETECKKLLIFDLDAGEWLCYPINKKLRDTSFPKKRQSRLYSVALAIMYFEN